MFPYLKLNRIISFGRLTPGLDETNTNAMRTIALSLMGTPSEVQQIQPWLDEFERLENVHVELTALEWVGGWEKPVKMALSDSTPDVSEIGSTWTASLASMNVLRPYSAMDLRMLGDRQAFLDATWVSCSLPGDVNVWAVPWLSDVHIIYFRHNILDAAHITPDFNSAQGMYRTLTALQQAGYPAPLSLIVRREPNLMHDAAPWVWSGGGHFLDPSGRKVAFDQERALNGLVQYFSLKRFMAPGYAENQDAWNKFLSGERLVAIGTPAHYFQAQQRNPGDVENWGSASVVGSSFVGGTNLVVWKNSRQAATALSLVRFLEAKASGFPASPHAFRTPCRVDAWNQLQSSDNTIVRNIVGAIKTGRSYKINPLWGILERGMIAELANLWQTLLEHPEKEVEPTIREAFLRLSERINMSLEG